MIIFHHQNVGQNQNIIIGNLPFETVENFKYLEVAVINRNDNREEIKCRINMENACYSIIHMIPPDF